MNYTYVQRPRYVLQGPMGDILELFCKICGSAIAGKRTQVTGRRRTMTGEWIEDHLQTFVRFNNYGEIKIEFEDGSFHVTNGCSQCLNINLAPDVLFELHNADMDVEESIGGEIARTKTPLRVVAIRTDGGGIA